MRGPHDQHIKESLAAYSTPSPWTHKGRVIFFQLWVFIGCFSSLSSLLFSTSFQNFCTFSSGKISWKLGRAASWLNIRWGKNMLAFSFPFCKDFGSKQVTWISKGSGTHTSLTNLVIVSLWTLPGYSPKLPAFLMSCSSAWLRPSSAAASANFRMATALRWPCAHKLNKTVTKLLLALCSLQLPLFLGLPRASSSFQPLSLLHAMWPFCSRGSLSPRVCGKKWSFYTKVSLLQRAPFCKGKFCDCFSHAPHDPTGASLRRKSSQWQCK